MLDVRLAFDPFLLHPDALGGAVAALGGLWRSPVDFVDDRVVDIATERPVDRLPDMLCDHGAKYGCVGRERQREIRLQISN